MDLGTLKHAWKIICHTKTTEKRAVQSWFHTCFWKHRLYFLSEMCITFNCVFLVSQQTICVLLLKILLRSNHYTLCTKATLLLKKYWFFLGRWGLGSGEILHLSLVGTMRQVNRNSRSLIVFFLKFFQSYA